MSIANVPTNPPAVVDANIRSGKPVRGATQWLELAEVSNYLNSHEMSLVASNTFADVITSSTSPVAMYFHFRTRQQVRAVLWVFTLRAFKAETTGVYCYGTIRVGATGTSYPFSISSSKEEFSDPQTVYIVEDRTQTGTAYQQSVLITRLGGNAHVKVDQISAYQLRRFGLDPEAGTTEYAADTPSCQTGTPIKDDTCYSIDGVVNGLTTAKENCRRASMFAWASPITTGVCIGQGSSWNELFHESSELLARYITSGATVTAINITIAAVVGATETAYIRFVADSGDSATIEVPKGVGYTWYSTSLLVKTEDLNDAKGRQNSTADRVTIAVYGNGNAVASDGNFALRLYSINIGET